MIIITKRNSIGMDGNSLKYYKTSCPYCGSEFVFSSIDLTRSRDISNHKEYLNCPVCQKNIFVTPEILRPKSMVEISKEEYKEIIPDKSNE